MQTNSQIALPKDILKEAELLQSALKSGIINVPMMENFLTKVVGVKPITKRKELKQERFNKFSSKF